jgi:phosphoserine phosphatase
MNQIKLVAFDIEGTLTEGLVWQKLHQIAGVTLEEDRLWFTQYYKKQITFSRWAELINRRYKDSRKKRLEFEKVLRDITFVPNAKDTIILRSGNRRCDRLLVL